MTHTTLRQPPAAFRLSAAFRSAIAGAVICAVTAFANGADELSIAEQLYSQHLDVSYRNPSSIGAAYFPETVFGSYGTTDVVEAYADLCVFTFDDFLLGRLDLWAFARVTGFIENPEMTSLPDALIHAGLDLGHTLRFDNGWSSEMRVAPSISSDIAEPKFGCLLTFNLYFAADPTLSFKIGGTYRPGWDVEYMPNAGIVWQPAEELRVEAGVPKSKITLLGNYMISPFATFEWRNVTYGLSGKEGIPKELTAEEMFVTAGIALCPMRTWTLTGEYGKFSRRKIGASVAENTTVELSKDSFFRVMLRSEF